MALKTSTDPAALQPVASLLDAAWVTLADIAELHSEDQRDNLFAVAISLYSRALVLLEPGPGKILTTVYSFAELLENSATSTQFINATLPVLKALAERAYSTASSFLQQVLEAFLSACLRLVDEALCAVQSPVIYNHC